MVSNRLKAGLVAINPTTGAETFTDGLAVYLYLARKAEARLPDAAHPKGCTVTAPAGPGAVLLSVDTSLGYRVGDRLGTALYVNPVPLPSGVSEPAQADLTVTSLPGPTSIGFSPALPTGCTIPAGRQFGFTGTFGEWSDTVGAQYIKALTSLAAQANADAEGYIAFVDFNRINFLEALGSTTTNNVIDLLRFPVPLGAMVTFELSVIGRPVTGFASYFNRVVFGSGNRAAGGAAANVVVTDAHTSTTTLASAAVTGDANDVLVQVTGETGVPYSWKASMRMLDVVTL